MKRERQRRRKIDSGKAIEIDYNLYFINLFDCDTVIEKIWKKI